MRFAKLIFVLLCASLSAHALTCVAVKTTASGAGTGADWTDAIAYSSLAGSGFVRGDLYYLADGNYGATLSLSTAASGTTTIELRKAQSYDFGRSSDGCTNDISAGWNASTMGASQAGWHASSGGGAAIVSFSSGYWILNGNGQNAGTTEVGCGGVNLSPPSAMTNYLGGTACGILIDDSTCTSTATNGCNPGGGVLHGAGAGIVIESIELFGQGLNSNGNNNSEPYGWFANGTLTSVAISHNYIHNMGTTAFTVVNGNWNNGSFDHNYHWGEFDGSVNHGESVQYQGANSGSVIHHNIWRDQQTNADVAGTDTGGNSTSLSIYDNADICSAGGTATTCRHNDGDVANFGTGILTALVYNNTWAHPSACGYVIGGGSGNIASTITLNNNVYYGCSGVDMTNGAGGTNNVDYNSYLNSSKSVVGAHDVSNNSASNPFTNVNLGVQLAVDGSNYNNRLSLGSPYDTLDLYGHSFTTDRGAAQFVTGGGSALATGVKMTSGTSLQ